jgi:hypothetical protein
LKQEYLVTDISIIDRLKEISYEGVKKELLEISNQKVYVLSFVISGEKEESAKRLSDINTSICDEFHCTILNNGSSEYFNKALFPYINDFEGKLRKLLYITSSLATDDKMKGLENIVDLESKDLGTIFDLIFTDFEFNKSIRSIFTKNTNQYSKDAYMETIQKINETTLWNSLIGDSIPALSKSYVAVKDARNDVMHAHNMDYKKYLEIKKQFKEINIKIDEKISEFISPIDHNTKILDFNKNLSEAIYRSQYILNYYNDLIDAPSPFYNYITYLGNFGKDISENSLIHYTNTIQNKLAEIQKNTTESGVLTAQLELQELLRNMSKQINQSIHDKIQNNINHSGSCFPEKKLIDQEDVGTQDLNNTK